MLLDGQVAGVEDEPRPASPPKMSDTAEWARQLEKSFSQVSRSDSQKESRGSSSHDRNRERDRNRDRDSNPIVKITGYDPVPQSRSHSSSSYSLEADMNRLGLDNIAGVIAGPSRSGCCVSSENV